MFVEKGPTIPYPELKFWGPGKRMTIVNKQDFQEKEILESLEIDKSPLAETFGICNVEEIRSRQAILRYMINNPYFVEWLFKAEIDSPLPGADQTEYDKAAEEFLKYFDARNPHTPFWQMVHDMSAFLNAENLPEKLAVFKQAIQQERLEEAENLVGRKIGEKILNIALIEGTLTFGVDSGLGDPKSKLPYKVKNICLKDEQVYGFKKFSQSILDVQDIDTVPEWTKRWRHRLNPVGIIAKIVARRANQRDQQTKDEAYKSTVISTVREELVKDVMNGLMPILSKLSWKSDQLIRGSNIKVFFSYSNDGLQVRIISWKAMPRTMSEARFRALNYRGYSPDVIENVSAHQKVVRDAYISTFVWTETAKLLASVQAQRHDLFSRMYFFKSPLSDPVYRWYAISNLYRKHFLKEYNMLTLHREFFFDQLKQLKEIAVLARKLSEVSKKIGYPLSWPELITDGKHVVSFDEIMPIHLLKHLPKGKQPVPISNIPEINGKIIGFTGSHEGGKTTASLAIVVLVYLAQSGLPVFGKNVKLNPKSLLGMVFLTRGEGSSSTARTLADKMVNVLKESKYVNPAEVIVVLDELGEGTQEFSGDELGRDILAKLKERKVSTIFNTQITALAEYADKELHAVCFRFTSDHQMHSGIGNGDMDGLRERSGLNAALAD